MCCPTPLLQATAASGQRCSRPPRTQTSVADVFTFEPIPEDRRPTVVPRLSSSRHACQHTRKRARRVLYPARVKKYLPAEQKDTAKRALVLLLSIVLYQVCSITEDHQEEVLMQPIIGQSGLPQCQQGAKLQGVLEANISHRQEVQVVHFNASALHVEESDLHEDVKPRNLLPEDLGLWVEISHRLQSM